MKNIIKTLFLASFLLVTFAIYAQQAVTITDGHRSSYPSIKSQFTYSALGGKSTATNADVAIAKTVVANLNITLVSNGIDVTGNTIPKSDLQNGAKMLAWSENIKNLALAGQASNPDLAAKDALIKLSKHLLKQWKLNQCNERDISGRNYTFYWETWKGWLCAMPLFQTYDASTAGSELAVEALSFIKKVYNYDAIHENPYNVNDLSYSTGDFIYTNTRFLFCMAAYNPTVDEQIADYIRIQRLYENYAKPRDGGIYWGSGIWIDGTFVHHGSVHSSYQYQLRQWIDDMWKMMGTPFEISPEAYNNITKGVYTLYLECADGAALAYTLGGRSPLNSVRNWMLAPSYFVKMIKLGGSVKGNLPFDPDMAAKYNYLTNTTTFDVPAENLDGFHQVNYAGMGLYRGKNNSNRWVATMRGLTRINWGAEFINRQNTFGRYQSHGVLEIIYANASNTKANSGYPTSSQTWDWNTIPGTTTIHHWPNPWYSIQVINSSSFARQKNNFVGALTNGKSGVFAMDYIEDPNNGGWGRSFNVIDNLKFKKSVFSYNNMMVCLGSDIQSAPTTSRPTDSICTNLFQYIYESVATPKGLYLNGSEAITSTTNSRIGLDGNNWLISPAGTGFYIPEQNGLLRVVKGIQSVPDHNVYPRNSAATEASYANKMISQNVAKAWLAHSDGISRYEYVVVPGTTPADMQSRVSGLGDGNGVYSILQQDAVAHVVNFENEDLGCYAVFQATNTLPAPLVAVSKPCLLLIKPVGNNYNVSICTPDLNPQTNASRPKGWLAGVTNISFKIEGVWYLDKATDKVEVTASDATSTTISVSLQHGLNEIFNLTATPTSISEMKSERDDKLKVFPNPCNNIITVNESGDDDIEWKIMDMTGRIVGIKKMNMDGRFDVSCLNTGLHILTMKDISTGVTKSAVFIKK